jgi:peptidoglycan/xylan/chitin deacetylase (PgdA/CDA1 family)
MLIDYKYLFLMKNNLLIKLLQRKKTGLIFAGHGVAKEWRNKELEVIHISLENFKEIIDLLEGLEYDFLSMQNIIDLSKNKFSYKKHWTHITFDDGYQNNFDIIYPYLKSKNIPFSVFISSHYVEAQELFPTFWVRLAHVYGKNLSSIYRASGFFKEEVSNNNYEKMLIYLDVDRHNALLEDIKGSFTTEELNEINEEFYNDRPMNLTSLKKLAEDSLVHLGAHSHLHISYHENQNVEKGINNIDKSLSLLKQWGVSGNTTFCYPNGDHSFLWANECRKFNIPLSFTSESGYISKRTNFQFMPRFWLSSKTKIFIICIISLLGNPGLNALKWLLKK